MQTKSEWAHQVTRAVEVITRFFTFPNYMTIFVANMHNVTTVFKEAADGELAVALVAWRATLIAIKAFPGCMVLQSPPPSIWEEGRIGPNASEMTSQFKSKET